MDARKILTDPITGITRKDGTLNKTFLSVWDLDKYFEPEIEEIVDVSEEEDNE